MNFFITLTVNIFFVLLHLCKLSLQNRKISKFYTFLKYFYKQEMFTYHFWIKFYKLVVLFKFRFKKNMARKYEKGFNNFFHNKYNIIID